MLPLSIKSSAQEEMDDDNLNLVSTLPYCSSSHARVALQLLRLQLHIVAQHLMQCCLNHELEHFMNLCNSRQ